MALVAPVGGEELLVKFGDGAGPEVFTASCLINTDRAVEFTSEAVATPLADCSTPSNPATMYRSVKSTDLRITGAGILDSASFLAILQWQQAGTRKNVKVGFLSRTGANGGYTLTGPVVITSLRQSGSRGEQLTVDITLEQAGAFTLAANA